MSGLPPINDAEHHLIVAHEVTNVGHDRTQLASMAQQAKEVIGTEKLEVVADRGYFKGEEILACDEEGVNALSDPGVAVGEYGDELACAGL